MVTVAVLDTKGLSLDIPHGLSHEVKRKIEETKSEKEKALRIASYTLLQRLYRELFLEEIPTILYTEEGRPYFDFGNGESQAETLAPENNGESTDENDGEKADENPRFLDTPPVDFNISHSGELVAVVISDGGCAVGIDVQRETAKERLVRVASRFFKDKVSESLDGQEQISDEEYTIRYFKAENGSIFELTLKDTLSHFNVSEDVTGDFSTLIKWSVLEANLKTSRGFVDYPEICDITERVKCKSLLFLVGKDRYAMSFSVLKG